MSDLNPHFHDAPPPYDKVVKPPSPWNPRNWSWKLRLGAIVCAVLIIVSVIVGAVLGTRANAYPDYSKLTYTLQDTYSGTDFFDGFDYFTGYDPTSGFVHYVDAPTAATLNLTYATSTTATIRVDTSETLASTGRKSARLTSKRTYNNGLFIFDILHSPYGCATWPALWLSDPSNWPAHGEIDVVEAVNQGAAGNQVTLHTTSGCSMAGVKRKETGSALTSNCYNGTDDNACCGVRGPPDTFGAALNANGGGVYALELRDAGIRAWFFPRGAVPDDVGSSTNSSASTPDPSGWGTPLADFPATRCDVGAHFANQSIIADIDLCGSWAGQESVYAGDGCPGSCTDYVAQNAAAFEEAYWEFGGFRVYAAS